MLGDFISLIDGKLTWDDGDEQTTAFVVKTDSCVVITPTGGDYDGILFHYVSAGSSIPAKAFACGTTEDYWDYLYDYDSSIDEGFVIIREVK